MKYLLSNCNLIDGSGAPVRKDASLGIEDGRIIHVGNGTADGFDLEIDLRGQYVLPGLIDTHVHLSGSGEVDSQFHADDPAMALKILSNAQKNLAAGITTVRDLGGWNEIEFTVREAMRRGEFAGPRMCLAGRFISITESGADYYKGMYRVADGVDAIRKAVREQVKNGADLIKIGVTGAVLVENGEPGATHFNEDEIRALVEEAHKFGRRVAAHAHGADGVMKAVQAGAATIEHGTFLHQNRDAIRLMAEKGVFLVPTLKPGWDVILDPPPSVPDWIVEKSKPIQDDSIQSLRLAREAGVPLAMGSDAGTPLNYHGENGLEIYWMQQAGMTAMEAVVSATGNAARALGWDAWLGTLETGKVADLVVFDENPLNDLRILADKERLQFVIKDGKVAVIRKGVDMPIELLDRHVIQN